MQAAGQSSTIRFVCSILKKGTWVHLILLNAISHSLFCPVELFAHLLSSQGLGTSTSKEGKEYFKNLDKHKKDFIWIDEQDGDAIELAFSKKKIEARKNWLRQYEVGILHIYGQFCFLPRSKIESFMNLLFNGIL